MDLSSVSKQLELHAVLAMRGYQLGRAGDLFTITDSEHRLLAATRDSAMLPVLVRAFAGTTFNLARAVGDPPASGAIS